MVGNGTYELSDADSGMHIWASTDFRSFVTFYLPGKMRKYSFSVYAATPLPGTHYRFICNANGSILRFALSRQTGRVTTLKCLVLLHMGEQQVLRDTALHPSLPYLDYWAVGVAPAPHTGGLAGNDGISLGNDIILTGNEGIYSVIGDYIDAMFNGLTWHVSGTCAGTHATGVKYQPRFSPSPTRNWYNNCMALG